MNIIASVIAIVSLVTSGFGGFSFHKEKIENKQRQEKWQNEIQATIDKYIELSNQNLGGDTVLPFAGHTYTLAASGVSSSATSIQLSSLTIPQTGQKIRDADLSDTFYVTLEPGSRTRQEIASCTTVTQNVDNSATLSGCSRGLSPITPYTASTTLQFSHGGSTGLIFSDPPQLFNQFTAKDNDETITGIYSFTIAPIVTNTGNSTSTAQLVTKAELNATSFQGVATSTETFGGIVELGTAAEASGGYNGGSNKPTVLQTKNASSTRVADTSVVVVASSTLFGYIDPTFIATTTPSGAAKPVTYTWAVQHTFNGTTTPNTATTTMNVPVDIDANTTNRLYLNSQPYAFPSTAPGTTTVASSDGAGNINFYDVGTLLTHQATSTYQIGGVTGNQVIAHNLGRVPKIVEIHGRSISDGASTAAFASSEGAATSTSSTGQNASAFSAQLTTGGESCGNVKTGVIVYFVDSTACATTEAEATLSDLSATSLTLNWTTNGGTARRVITIILR